MPEAGDVPGHVWGEDIETIVIDIFYHPVHDFFQGSLSIYVSNGMVYGVTDAPGLGDVDDLIHVSHIDEGFPE